MRIAASLDHAATYAAVCASACVAALAPPLAPAAHAQGRAEGKHPIDDVRYLADDELAGRRLGSAAADSAAAYIARRFEEVGLEPTSGGWIQSFEVSAVAPLARRAAAAGINGQNVIGILPGSDSALRREAVVVGAHYDHLGQGEFGSLDSAGAIHNGADDNASGVAAVIAAAARLAFAPPERTVVFIAFGGEELGLLGSSHYVRHPVVPIERTLAMINLDMVGRLRNERLIVYGTATAAEFSSLLDSLNPGFDLVGRGDGFGPSDQSSFYAARLPVLHLFTDLHEDYHRASDDWEKINAEGLARVAEFTASIARAIADRDRPLTFVEVAAAGPHSAVDPSDPPITPGYGAYLGTVPDMAGSAGGVRLVGVRAGGPADRAGLRSDDVVTRIGEHRVSDLQAMTDALRSHKAGDVVEIGVLRDGKSMTLEATLGTRGG